MAVKQKTRIPTFISREEEATWWDTHDITDYLDELTPLEVTFDLAKPKQETVVVRLQKTLKDQISTIARRKGLHTSSLIRMWVMEKLQTSQHM